MYILEKSTIGLENPFASNLNVYVLAFDLTFMSSIRKYSV